MSHFSTRTAGQKAHLAPRKRHRPWFPLLDPLELRRLLTIDLTGSFQALVPSTVASGGNQPVTLVLNNLGTTAALGTLQVDFYAMPDGSAFDPNTATFLKEASPALAVGAGGQQQVNVTVPISAALPAGNYDLFAVIDPNHHIADTNTSNNLAQSSILAVTQPNVDLVPSFGPSGNIPATVIAGSSVTSSVQIVMTNDGTVSIPAGVTIAAEVVARPVSAVDDSQDIVINKLPISMSVGSLAANGSRNLTVPLAYPAGMAAGPYQIWVKADTGNDLAETNEANNEAMRADTTLAVVSSTTDFTLAFDSHNTLPGGTLISNGVTKFPLKLDITNNGNITIGTGVSGTITISAHNTGDNSDVTLQSFSVSLSGIASGNTRTITLSPFLPLGMETGSYTLDATLVTGIATDLPGNNTDSTMSQIMVTRGFADISDQILSDTFPPATLLGTAKAGSVKVNLVNLGNVTIPANQHVNILIALRPSGALDNSSDVPIGEMNGVSISGLAGNGGHKSVMVSATVPISGVGDGDTNVVYDLVATLVPVEPLGGDVAGNNESLGNSLTVGPAFKDLSMPTFSDNFPASVVSGTPGAAFLTLENLGNVPAVGSVSIKVMASSDADFNDAIMVGISTISVNLASGATTARQSVAITLPTSLQTRTYTLYLVITPTGFVDSNSDNNLQQLPDTVTTAPKFVDLDFQSATQPFGANELGGQTGTASFKVENLGNVANNAQYTITYYASPTDVTIPGQIPAGALVIGTRTLSLNLAPGAASALLTMPLTLPTPLVDTSYVILAKVSATGLADSNPDNNITVPNLGTVLVSHFTTVFPPADGDTLTFTATSTQTGGGVSTQHGSFITNLGVKGTYTMATNGSNIASLSLIFNNSPIPYTGSPHFDASAFLFGGNTINFALDSAGSQGSMVLSVNGKTAFFTEEV